MRVRKDDTGQFGHADLLAQWDEERNGPLKPSDVSRCDPARVWWRGERGHSWQLSVRTRAFNDAGCPYCGRRLTLEGFNSAECLDAGILHLWHPHQERRPETFAGLRPYGQENLAAMPDVRVRMAREPAGDSQREPQVPVVPWGKGALSRQGQQRPLKNGGARPYFHVPCALD